MNDQPREQKAPEGADQPTVEQPQAGGPAAAHPDATTAMPTEGVAPAAGSAAPGQPDAAQAPAAAAGQPGAPERPPAAGQDPSAPEAAAHPGAAPGQPRPAPPTPQLAQPGPGHAYGAWGPPPAARQPGGFRRFVGHRATQLVAVGVLGLLVGGGIVGGIAAATHHSPRDGRPGVHRQYNGPGQGFNGHGFRNPGNSGNNPGDSGNSGGGNGI